MPSPCRNPLCGRLKGFSWNGDLRHHHQLHINDNPGTRDDHLALGDGHIDRPWPVSELKRHHFDRTMILGLSSSENESVTDMLARARNAADFLNGLL